MRRPNRHLELHDPLRGWILPRPSPRRIGCSDPVEERLCCLLLHTVKVGYFELQDALDNDAVLLADSIDSGDPLSHDLSNGMGATRQRVRDRGTAWVTRFDRFLLSKWILGLGATQPMTELLSTICAVCQTVVSYGVIHICQRLLDGPPLPEATPVNLTIVKGNQYIVTNNFNENSLPAGTNPAPFLPQALNPLTLAVGPAIQDAVAPAQTSAIKLVSATVQATSGVGERASVVVNPPPTELVGLPIHLESAPVSEQMFRLTMTGHAVSGTIGTQLPFSGVFGKREYHFATQLGSTYSGLRFGPGDESAGFYQ